MTDTILLHLDRADAAAVEAIFNKSDNPGFTIVNKIDLVKEYDVVHLEMCFDSIIDLWYLAKRIGSDEAVKLAIEEIKKPTIL